MTQPVKPMAGQAAHVETGAAQHLVINLCSSTTPMSLVRPAFKELERFTFFVSRRREDGRERFRLHMGYFASRADAEQWLGVVRTVYPGAWISDAPGKKLRGEPPAPDLSGRHRVIDTPAPTVATTSVSGEYRAPAAAPAPVDATSSTQTGLAPVVLQVQAPTVAQPPVLSAARPAAARAPIANKEEVAKPTKVAAAPVSKAPPAAADVKPAPVPAVTDMSDSQVLRVLEVGPGSAAGLDSEVSDVPMVRKLDAHSLQALRRDLSKNLPVPFAVQLEWSAAPIDVRKIPPLAIFRAYTLYTVGCQFENRRWYGLRLGFFSDALSAKQVAQYVRSEFKSVSVVPVSTRERSQADATGGIDVDKTAPVRHGSRNNGEEITLLPENERAAKSVNGAGAASPAATAAANSAAPGKPVNGAKQSVANVKPNDANNGARVLARGAARTGKDRTLEETLEILGASQLTIDNGRGERVNIRGRRAGADAKTSTFSKLLDRLADRLRS